MGVLNKATLSGSTGSGSSSVSEQLNQTVETALLSSVGFGSAGRLGPTSMFKYNQNIRPTGAEVVFPSNPGTDWRVRLSLAPKADYFVNSPLLAPLLTQLGGTVAGAGIGGLFGVGPTLSVIFPYTPQLQIQHSANYNQQKLTHSNYAQYYYDNSEVQAINLTAEFTVQNINEGQYLLAVIYLFRSVTKMFFGLDPKAGNPPPLMYLNGYGKHYLPNVPCVVTNFTHTMPADVDYMDIPQSGVNNGFAPQPGAYSRLDSTRLPTTSTISIGLQPVYSRKAQSTAFSLEDFARGGLVNRSGSAEPVSSFGRSGPDKGINGGFI